MLTRLWTPSRGLMRLASRCTASYSSLEQGSGAFPWRSAPAMQTKPIWMELIKAVAYKLLYTRTFPTDADAQDFWDKFHSEGVAAAFRTVTDAIFHHRTLQRSDEESTAVTDVPDLSRVVDSKLATFYEQALNDVKNNGQNIVYELLEVQPPRIPTMELLVGLHRDDPLAKRKACKRTKGLFNLDLFGTIIPRDGLSEQELEEAWEVVRTGADKLVLRVWVDVTAKEKFYIVDDTTGETVQGSEEPQTNVHRLLLETSFYTDPWKNATEAEHDWLVVDIDNWLEGNSFYVVEDGESGKHNEVSEVDDDSRK